MSGDSNKLGKLWQELKRRRVIHVITVYATAAFVIIELAGNLAEPLNLPDILPTIVIIVLAVGFPLAVILSWIYDLTSEGMEKTKPLEEIRDAEKPTVPNAWKIATIVSFVAIIGLVTFNIVAGSKGLRRGDIQSVVILPFNNLTGDDQLEWASAAMHSILNTDMGKVGGLNVLSNTTAHAIKEANLTATEIAEKFNVDAVLETDLTCYGDMLCGRSRLISTYPEENIIWEEKFLEKKSQVLIFTNQTIKKISQKLKVELTRQEETLLAEAKEINPVALDAYLGGRYIMDQSDYRSITTAIDSFNKAIEIEPEWAAPYAGLAEYGTFKQHFDFSAPADIIRMIYYNLRKALDLDPYSVHSHYIQALVAYWIELDWDKAEKEFLTAIDLNPSHVRSHSFYADMLSKLRRTDEALYHGKESEKLDPENPFTLAIYTWVLLENGQCQEALYYAEKGLNIDPDHPIFPTPSIYECLGDYDKAFEALKGSFYPLWKQFGLAERFEKTFRERGWMAFIKEGIRVDEEYLKEDTIMHGWRLAGKYVNVGEYDKAMDIYDILYENDNHNTMFPQISAKPTYDKMKGNPRYLALLEKLNLPTTDD